MSDRGLRYRATACPPPGERQCAFCGSRRNVEVGHLDGHEENTAPENLIWNCRACNTRLGVIFKRLGLGRRTRQFNPSNKGANSLGQWMAAITSMKGQSDAMTVPAAVALIHETPASKRSEFARQIWDLRRQRGTDRQVPL